MKSEEIPEKYEIMKISAVLFDKLEEKGLTVADFSNETGIPSDRIYQWRRKRGNPKGEDVVLIQAWLDKNTSLDIDSQNDVAKKMLSESEEHKLSVDNALADAEKKLSLEVIANLTRSNMILAEAQKIFAEGVKLFGESNKNLSDTNSKLLDRVPATADDQSQMFEAVLPTIRNLQELLKEVALGKKFSSAQEVNALLNKSDISTFPRDVYMGTQKG